MLITTRQRGIRLDASLLSLSYNKIDLQLTKGDKILGVYIEENCQWNNHLQHVCKKVSSYIWLLSKIKSYLSLELRSIFYSAYILPQFNYCNIIWGNSSNYNVSKITKLQRRACKVILENQYENLESAMKKLNLLSFDQNVFVNKAKMMYKVANGLVPQYVVDLFQSKADGLQNTSLRSVSNHNFTIPQPKYSLYKESLSYSGPVISNAIPTDIKKSSTINAFVNILKRKSFETLTKMLVASFGPKQSLSGNAIDKSLYLPCTQHKNQNVVAYGYRVATIILRQSPILKSHGYNTSHVMRFFFYQYLFLNAEWKINLN